MPNRDGTGPRGTLTDCVSPKTGLRRPLMRYSRPVDRLGPVRRGRGRRNRW